MDREPWLRTGGAGMRIIDALYLLALQHLLDRATRLFLTLVQLYADQGGIPLL